MHQWQSHLNHLMMLHVHKDRTDALTLVDVANDYVGEKENRKQLFGKFSVNDIPNKFYFVKVNTNRKLETRTKGIVDKCSDLTYCTKKYALTEGPKRRGGVNVGHSLSPPCHFMLATGLEHHFFIISYKSIVLLIYAFRRKKNLEEVLHLQPRPHVYFTSLTLICQLPFIPQVLVETTCRCLIS